MKHISDFPSDGIIYTTDAVMFHRSDVEKFLPLCDRIDFGLRGGFDAVFDEYSGGGQLISADKFAEMVKEWWPQAVSNITNSAIAYKPAEAPAAYLFESAGSMGANGKPTNEYYVARCKDAMAYKSLVKNHRKIITEKPIAAMVDNPEIIIAGMEVRLREREMILAKRGANLWMVYDPTKPANMRTLVMAAFELKPI